MKAIFISDNGGQHYKIKLNAWLMVLLPLIAMLFLAFIINKISLTRSNHSISRSDILIIQRFDSYLKRLATLEAQTQRLNELGARIAQKNHIDLDVFSLDKKPAQGGIVAHAVGKKPVLNERDLINSIQFSEQALARQEKIFSFYNDLTTVAMNKKLIALSAKSSDGAESRSSEHHYSSPVNTGYISSNYGYRRDPINGRRRFHEGIDIAAKKGTPVSAIALGFVSFTGRKGGYGKVVEINHSDSFKSRYAHLSRILVKKGQVVHKGDTIAKMGNTGRSTGSHLHLEVRKNGKAVNPNIYLKDVLKFLKP